MIEIQTSGTDDFYAFLGEIYRTGQRTMREQVKTHFRGVVRNMMALTFPMGSKDNGASLKLNSKGDHTGAVDYAAGKKAGRLAMIKDLNNAFLTPGHAEVIYKKDPLALKTYKENLKHFENESPAAALAWYLSVRNRRKRVNRAILRPVTPRSLKYVFAELQKRQGFVPAGWKEACSKLDVPIASWIDSMPARGGCMIEQGEDFYYISAVNKTGHPKADLLQKRADIAMQMQTNNMARILKAYWERVGATKGFIT